MAHDTSSVAVQPASSPPELPDPRTKQWRPSEDDSEVMQSSTLTCLFNDATLYTRAIADCSSERSCIPGQIITPEEPIQDFAELVGHDLGDPEKLEAGRFARFSAADWASDDGPASGGRYTAEPDAMTDMDESASSSESSSEYQSLSRPIPASQDVASNATLVAEPPEPAALTPEQIVHILGNEFGELAPEGEEKLICQTDGAVIQDVVILGTFHITSHRIAFHASMPAFKPRANDVIKAGPAYVHRRGLHRKKRVWLELSHDFVSSFPSSREEDRIRPWKSVMLSSVLEVYKEDPAHPRMLRNRLDGKSGIRDCHLEFDTVESAREWRRELQAALFFCRRRMRKFLSNTDPDNVEGVRIGIPLDCITDYTRHLHANMLPILTLTVSTSDRQSGAVSSDGEKATQSIQFAFHKLDSHWDHLEELIQTARQRRNVDNTQSRSVVIDFGLEGLTPSKDENEIQAEDSRSKEAVVCDMLAIDYSPDVWVTRASFSIGLLCVGFLVVSPEWIGFWSKSLTLRDVRYRLHIASVHKATATDFIFRSLPRHGLVLELEGHSNLKFHFRSEVARDNTMHHINAIVEQYRGRLNSEPLISPLTPRSSSSSTDFPRSTSGSLLSPLSKTFSRVRGSIDPRKVLQFPKAINVSNMLLHVPPKHFVCLTIGSRGDVQPYIALGLGLKREGHTVTIVTHEEYKGWIEGFGLHHRSAGGDPGALMKLSVENKMFSPQFFRTSLTNYRTWLDSLLLDAWENCRDAEVLLESPYAMAGVHIAEALSIPYFRVCTMPWTKTVQFPHPFISPPVETPTFNSISYVLFDNIFWAATSSQVNRWRRESLKLDPIVMSHVAQSKIPILYNFSSAVVSKPLDWSDSKIICGYWFLDNPDLDWTPAESLLLFMEKARLDGKPLVYIGFGSITVPDPRAVTEHIVDAVVKSDVRAIISRGWSSRMSKKDDSDVVIPDSCYIIDKVPHDWLFPQVDAVLHHGGAGTTGASLRAGVPTLIRPWFGDQYFWASRVQKLGAGMRVPSLRVSDLSAALTRATTDRIMKEKAAAVGQKIRAEDGVRTALHSIYTYLPRASSEGLSPE